MQIAIIGYGIEGHAALEYWRKQGAAVTICDKDTTVEVPDGIASQLGAQYLTNLSRFDVVFRTAGIHPEIILKDNPDVADRITTTTNEFMRVCPTKHIIGVTGTKGKGTTSTLIARMLTAAGEQVFLGGNIGVSPLTFLPSLNENAWVVLELSSFQLNDLRYSPNIAVCLMVVPEHLDWHHTMDNYIIAKAQLFEHQTPADLAIYYADNELSRTIAGYSPALKMPFYTEPGAHVENDSIVIASQKIIRTDELKLIGKHNWQNVCAALTVAWQITQNTSALQSALMGFTGLEHRLEFVRGVNGVEYYNDSFAATPDAAMAALDALPQPKVIILGGFDRGLPLGNLAQSIAVHSQDIRSAVLIGASGKRLASELEAVGFTNYELETAPTMPRIVDIARKHAHSGDVVLLSPGFASFDMFKNFEERGRQFKEAVKNL